MKKLVVFVFLLAGLFCTTLVKNENNPLFALDGVEKVCFVSSEKYENADLESVNCGDLVFNFCSLEISQQNLQEFCGKAEGVQIYLKDVTRQNILSKLKASIISTTEIDGVLVMVAYTPFYQDCIYVDGKKANLQLAEKDGRLIAGLPAILTGF